MFESPRSTKCNWTSSSQLMQVTITKSHFTLTLCQATSLQNVHQMPRQESVSIPQRRKPKALRGNLLMLLFIVRNCCESGRLPNTVKAIPPDRTFFKASTITPFGIASPQSVQNNASHTNFLMKVY